MAPDDAGRRSHALPAVVACEPDVVVRRVFDPPSDRDGARVLVDRLWPRGLTKADAVLDEWCRLVAPSTALRRWFGHDPSRFEEFDRRYRVELAEPERAGALQHLRELAETRRLTLLTGTRTPDISQAAVLADVCRPPATAPMASCRRLKPIVVGVDGSAGACAALEWAVVETGLCGRSVHTVMARRGSPEDGEAWAESVTGVDSGTDCEEVLGAVVADAAGRGGDQLRPPGVTITHEVTVGHPGHVLLLAAADAHLLVVGSRGSGGLGGARMGSVSRYVVAHARGPVAVVPAREHHLAMVED